MKQTYINGIAIGMLFVLGATINIAQAQEVDAVDAGVIGVPVEPEQSTILGESADGVPPASKAGLRDDPIPAPIPPSQEVSTDIECPVGYNKIQLLTYPVQTKCVCAGADCLPADGVGEDGTGVISTTREEVETNEVRIIPSPEEADKGVLQAANVSAEYSREITVEGSQLVMKTSAGSKDINVLPEEAIKISETSEVSSIQKIELNEESEKPVYSVYGEQTRKLFGLFSVTLNIQTRIDAQTGDIISMQKPWWRFFTW